MKRTLKFVGYIVLGLIGVFLIAFVIVNSYRKEILVALNQKLGEEINGDINIGKLGITIFHDFPNVSLSLRDIYMRGPQYARFHQDFLRAENIEINVEGLKLFRKDVSIKSVDIINGEIFIFKARSGYTNLDILRRTGNKDTTTGHQPDQVNFKNINLKNVIVSYHDSLKQKEFDIHFLNVRSTITPGDSSTVFRMLGQMKFIGLMFNAQKGSYLKNTNAIADFSLQFFPHTRQLVINPSSLNLTLSDIQLSGLFSFANPSTFQLNIQADSLDFREGVSVLTESLSSKLDKLTIEKKVNVKVIVGGSLVPESQPAVDMTFAFRNSKVSSDKIDLDPVTLRGSLTNHFDSTSNNNNQNTQLNLDTLYGKFNGLRFGANASVSDFENPNLNLNAKFDIELKELNADTLSDIDFKSGRFVSNFLYSGTLEEYLATNRKQYLGKLKGVARITGGEVVYVAKQMTFEKVEASIRFSNEECKIENISLLVNKSPILVKGKFAGFIPFFTQPDKRIKAALTISSSQIDFAKIFSEKKTKKLSEEKVTKNKQLISRIMDMLYTKLELEMIFDIKKFINRNFIGESLTGKIILADDKLQLKEVKMKFADGRIDFSASLNHLQKNINPFILTAKVENADVKNFFHTFSNFNQTTIRDENLSGKINADISIEAAINKDLDVLTSNLTGDVKFKLENGKLIEFVPLQNVSNFLFKNRDQSNVQFGEINGHFNMKGTELDISRMEVQSTLLTLYVEGRYSLKDSTDLGIQVPLSNLKSRDQHIPPENIGTDKRVGASIFLRARSGKDGKTAITYDPFKKFKKSKKHK